MDPVVQKVDVAEEQGCIPLGVLYFNVEKEQFEVQRLPGVAEEDVNALLEKIGLVMLTPKEK